MFLKPPYFTVMISTSLLLLQRTQSFSLIVTRRFHLFNKVTQHHSFHKQPHALKSTSSLSMSSIIHGKPLVSVEDCLTAYTNTKDTSSSSRVIFVDGSWHLSKDRSARTEYQNGPRLPAARFFDVDDVAAKGGTPLNPKSLPHTMPPAALFAAVMDEMDIRNEDHVVIYATPGCAFASRAWFTFRSMGHDVEKVHHMQGSLEDWMGMGGEVDTTVLEDSFKVEGLDWESVKETKYQAKEATTVVNMDLVSNVVKTIQEGGDPDSVVVDARGAGRFQGTAPEPRPGVRGGHMPGSLNVPFTDLLDADSGYVKYKPVNELKKVFEDAGVDVETDKKIICSCGSGVTACVISTALEQCGRDPSKTFVYDGSWIEWGSDPDTPIVT